MSKLVRGDVVRGKRPWPRGTKDTPHMAIYHPTKREQQEMFEAQGLDPSDIRELKRLIVDGREVPKGYTIVVERRP